MNRRCLTGFMVWCALLIAAAQSWAVAPDDGRKASLVRVRGANAMARMTDAWAQAFSAANPGETVIVAGGGTDAGFDALFDKAADLVMASRKVLTKELQAAALSDCRLGESPVCFGAVAVVTHPSNPIKELTLEQLGNILKGETTNWKDVGGPDEPITVYMGQPIAGTAQFLRERVMAHEYFGSDVKVRDYYHHIIKELARKKPPALAYTPFLDAVNAEKTHMVKILGLKKDQNSPAIYPSEATIKDKSYPLMLPLYFYWNAGTAGPLVRKFVEFCKSRCAAGK